METRDTNGNGSIVFPKFLYITVSTVSPSNRCSENYSPPLPGVMYDNTQSTPPSHASQSTVRLQEDMYRYSYNTYAHTYIDRSTKRGPTTHCIISILSNCGTATKMIQTMKSECLTEMPCEAFNGIYNIFI